MILNFIAESMVSSPPACTPLCCDRAMFSAVCSARAISKTCPSPSVRSPRATLAPAVAAAGGQSLRLGARNLHHLGPLLDVLAQVGVELGGRHYQRHRPPPVPCLFYLRGADRPFGFALVPNCRRPPRAR